MNAWCRVLIASIMEEYNHDAWVEIVQRCEAVGVDGFELNFSCPHGMPERCMGMAMGQDPKLVQEVRNSHVLLTTKGSQGSRRTASLHAGVELPA